MPSHSPPTVSIVVPIFNRSGHVPDLVDTLTRQTMTDWEAIIVDDASTAAVAEAVQPFLADPRVRYLRLDHNGGPATARNRGVDAACGRYIAFLDSDDLWHPDKLARQVAALEAQAPGSTFCVTQTTVLMPGGWARLRPDFDPKPGQSFASYLYRDGGFAQVSSLLLPRELALRVRFEEGLRQYEDHLYYMCLDAAGATYRVVREPLTQWRNDARLDRLSARDDLARGAAFLAAARSLLTDKDETAFRLRVLGGVLLRQRPLEAAALIGTAIVQRAITPKGIMAIVARETLPPAIWNIVRRHTNRAPRTPQAA